MKSVFERIEEYNPGFSKTYKTELELIRLDKGFNHVSILIMCNTIINFLHSDIDAAERWVGRSKQMNGFIGIDECSFFKK